MVLIRILRTLVFVVWFYLYLQRKCYKHAYTLFPYICSCYGVQKQRNLIAQHASHFISFLYRPLQSHFSLSTHFLFSIAQEMWNEKICLPIWKCFYRLNENTSSAIESLKNINKLDFNFQPLRKEEKGKRNCNTRIRTLDFVMWLFHWNRTISWKAKALKLILV